MSIAELSQLLALSESELQQVLDYAATLPKSDAAEHFHNLLGDSPQAVKFITDFNSRRHDVHLDVPRESPTVSAPSSNPPSDADAVPKHQRKPKKKQQQPLHALAPRKVDTQAVAPGTAYYKKNAEDEYISGAPGGSTPSHKPATTAKRPTGASPAPAAREPVRTAGGFLISDLPASKSKPRSHPNTRTSTPGPSSEARSNSPATTTTTTTTTISVTGGTPMRGASNALSDLDAAIRALELTTNSTRPGSSTAPADVAARRCGCVATRHPLQAAAPNCLSCGKVVCLKEGLGPCTFCGTPLLTAVETQALLHELKAERGRERMAADRDAHRRADVAGVPRPFGHSRDNSHTAVGGGGGGPVDLAAAEAEARAREHRDRLLTFQAQNARRTTVRDEAADFDVPTGGASFWASPEERARELRRQQQLLREMEWNARPDYEKRRQVMSIDLVGGKVVRRMVAVDRPAAATGGSSAGDVAEVAEDHGEGGAKGVLQETSLNRGGGGASGGGGGGGGAFSRNPLLGGLIRPVYDVKGDGAQLEGRKPGQTSWRRIQDDLDDNEAVILDGGAFITAASVGGGGESRSTGHSQQRDLHDEPACG